MTRIAVPALALIACLASPAGQAAPRRGASPPVPVAAPPVATGPEYVGNFEARVGDVARPLERQRLEFKTKASYLGSAKAGMEVAGARSPVRFAAGQPLEFIVRVASQDSDPQSTITLYTMIRKKNARYLQYASGKFGFGSGGVTSTQNRQAVPFDARRYGTQFFRLAPVAPLPPGEYMLTMGVDGFLFGID
jgi:hypothetical protein